jgi:hypothetical protein
VRKFLLPVLKSYSEAKILKRILPNQYRGYIFFFFFDRNCFEGKENSKTERYFSIRRFLVSEKSIPSFVERLRKTYTEAKASGCSGQL